VSFDVPVLGKRLRLSAPRSAGSVRKNFVEVIAERIEQVFLLELMSGFRSTRDAAENAVECHESHSVRGLLPGSLCIRFGKVGVVEIAE